VRQARYWIWLLLVFGVMGGVAGENEIEEAHQLSLDFVTPHTKWAKPYAGGRVRVLYFTKGTESNAREIVELMERFDIQADAVYWTNIVDTPTWEWHGGAEGLKRILRLLAKPYDVYLFQEIPLANLTAEAQYKLLKPVTEGAGLVLLGTGDGRVLKPQNRLNPPPSFLKGTGAEAYRINNGRGIRLPAPPNIPYRFGWEVEYDHWIEGLGRAVLWAARREPKVELSVSIPETINQEKAKGTMEVRCDSMPARARFAGHLRCEEDGATIPLKLPVQVQSPARIALPHLRAGRYYVAMWLRTPRGVEAWATGAFTVTSARGIESIKPERTWAEVGETFVGQINLREPLQAKEWLEARLKDRKGRILAWRRMKPQGSVASYSFKVQSWFPMLLELEAVRHDSQGEAAAASSYLHVTKRNRDQFNFLVWDYPRGPSAPYAEEALKKLGMTIQLAGGTPPPFVAAFDVAWVPYTTRILAPLDERGYMQPVCWNDEPAVQRYIQGIVDQQQGAREHGVFVYSLGDETVTRGACLHPACLIAYRRYLQEQYKNIESLNSSWGSHYTSFDQIEVRDNDEATALREGNFPRWFDRQAFQCYNFVEFCRRFGEAYRRLDPKARTGFEGAGGLDQGDDYDRIIHTNGFWSPYPGPGDEILRSIAPRDFPRSNWMGYQRDADSLLRWYWRMVTRGSDAVWWWRWNNIGQYHGLLRPDLNPFPAVQAMMQDTKVMREGLGDLLLKSAMVDDGIALLYSFPSAHAVRVEHGASYGDYQSHHVAWHRTLRDLGLQFRYITDRMLRHGEWKMERYKVLILPRAEALSDREARVIRRFVGQGGTVIADLRPGLFDEHCKPRSQGVLDELFGIRQAGRGPADTGKAELKAKPGVEAFDLTFPSALYDPHVRSERAIALGQAGETPLLLVRRVGRGKAILLNFGLPSSPAPGASQAPESAARVFSALLQEAGVRRVYSLQTPDGKRLRDIELIRWQTGKIELLALFREEGKGGKACIGLPAPRQVYDLRMRRALGKVSTLQATLKPGRAYFFALLPQAVPEIRLSAPIQTHPGGIVPIKVQIPRAAGKHAIRLRAILPSGKEADWFHPILVADNKAAETVLPLAYNDPKGIWLIEAKELFTGRTVSRSLRVQ